MAQYDINYNGDDEPTPARKPAKAASRKKTPAARKTTTKDKEAVAQRRATIERPARTCDDSNIETFDSNSEAERAEFDKIASRTSRLSPRSASILKDTAVEEESQPLTRRAKRQRATINHIADEDDNIESASGAQIKDRASSAIPPTFAAADDVFVHATSEELAASTAHGLECMSVQEAHKTIPTKSAQVDVQPNNDADSFGTREQETQSPSVVGSQQLDVKHLIKFEV